MGRLGRADPQRLMDYQAPDTAQAALRGLCPLCGANGLFVDPISFADNCATCALDFTQFNVGDGPAAFLIMIVGAVITIGAVSVELRFAPPFWVHILLWLPLTTLLVIGMLRIAKGVLITLEYRNRAREGRIVE